MPSRRNIKALILAPTRELALQVTDHLKAVLDPEPFKKKVHIASEPSDPESEARLDGPPRVSIAAIVGGMSVQKQRRLLNRGVDILVATPGRLWDLIGEVILCVARNHNHLQNMSPLGR